MHIHFRTDLLAGVLDDDHAAVVEVADGLAGLLAGLEQQDDDVVTGRDGRAQGQREGVQVEDLHPGEGCGPGQVGVQGEQGRRAVQADPDQLGVDFRNGGDVELEHLDVDVGLALKRLEDLEPPASLSPTGVVTGIRQALQLGQHRRADEHLAVQEASSHDVQHSAVDRDGAVDEPRKGRGRGLPGRQTRAPAEH